MVEALDALPKDLGDDQCQSRGASWSRSRGLRATRAAQARTRPARSIAPDIADEHDYQQLLAEERRAQATHPAAPPTSRRRVDRHQRPRPRPRRQPAAGLPQRFLRPPPPPPRPRGSRTVETDEFAQLPLARQRGEAFVAFLENIPTTSLPRHGGTATSVMITLDYDTLASRGRARDHLHRRPDHRRPSPPAGLPGRDHPRRPRRRQRDPRRRPDQSARHRCDPQSPQLRDQGCTALGCTMPADSARPTTSSRGRKAARPAFKTASCSAPSTTTAPTTPAGPPITSPTGRPPSPGEGDRQSTLRDLRDGADRTHLPMSGRARLPCGDTTHLMHGNEHNVLLRRWARPR